MSADFPRRGVKAKTIKQVLSKKLLDWLESIEDDDVRELAARNTIVTGGCIASMLLGEKVNDYDLYFRNRKTAIAVAKYYTKRFEVKNKHGIPCSIYVDENSEDRISVVIKSAGVASEDGSEKKYEYFEGRPSQEAGEYVADIMGDPDAQTEDEIAEIAQGIEDGAKYRPVFMSSNAITLSHKIQIVLRFYGEPDELHENYDYVHCMNYWDSAKGLVLRSSSLEALLSRELRYVGSKYPICSLIRMRKFIARGWTINAGQVLKMAMQVAQLDLENPDVLQEQLTGVDVAYFIELIGKVKEKDPEKVNAAYLTEVIDRMF